ncbi:hypothetical protein MTO96_051277 [Rhipicephalus appendiculatus]
MILLINSFFTAVLLSPGETASLESYLGILQKKELPETNYRNQSAVRPGRFCEIALKDVILGKILEYAHNPKKSLAEKI